MDLARSGRQQGTPNVKNSKKIQVLKTFHSGGISKREVARRFNISPSQLRIWLKQKPLIEWKYKIMKHSKSLHNGPPPSGLWFEGELLAWVNALRLKDVPISSKLIVTKILSIDPLFLTVPKENRLQYVYRFMRRHCFTFRRATHRGPKLSSSRETVLAQFSAQLTRGLSIRGAMSDVTAARFVNMDQTAIYFEPKLNTTLSERGLRTVSIRCSGSNQHRLSAFLSVSADGRKLAPFLVFKAAPNGHIERRLDDILPENCFGCCQRKGWADERSMDIWLQKVWKPYLVETMDDDAPIVNKKATSALLLDDFKCHTQASFGHRLEQLSTHRIIITPGYTGVLQPCDVGIIKPLKTSMEEKYLLWASEMFLHLNNDESLPIPSRTLIAKWLCEAWEDSITPQIIINTFRKIGIPRHFIF